MAMSEFEQDPSANTGRFRAFYEAQEQEATKQAAGIPRGVLIGGIVVLVVIVIVVLAATL
jgi:hypothetical protein